MKFENCNLKTLRAYNQGSQTVRSTFRDLFVWFEILLVCFDSLCPSQQFFSYVGTGLPGLNQY